METTDLQTQNNVSEVVKPRVFVHYSNFLLLHIIIAIFKIAKLGVNIQKTNLFPRWKKGS